MFRIIWNCWFRPRRDRKREENKEKRELQAQSSLKETKSRWCDYYKRAESLTLKRKGYRTTNKENKEEVYADADVEAMKDQEREQESETGKDRDEADTLV